MGIILAQGKDQLSVPPSGTKKRKKILNLSEFGLFPKSHSSTTTVRQVQVGMELPLPNPTGSRGNSLEIWAAPTFE